ncbi:hypothetical protein TNCV_703521 [Trichonephila clavipes]|nr:hypothetical protein TNCV_703521 [Trichonephila clavipes]
MYRNPVASQYILDFKKCPIYRRYGINSGTKSCLQLYSCHNSNTVGKELTSLHGVSLNVVYKLEGEVEDIVRIHNYMGKHERKAISGAERKLPISAHVVSSFQTWTACDEHQSLYER